MSLALINKFEAVTTIRGLYELREEIITKLSAFEDSKSDDPFKYLSEKQDLNFFLKKVENAIQLEENSGHSLCKIRIEEEIPNMEKPSDETPKP